MYLLQFLRMLNINFKYVSFVIVFIIVFYLFLTKHKQVFSPFETIHRQFLWHHPSMQVIEMPVQEISKFFAWIIIFHVMVASSCISMYDMALITYRHQSVILILLLSFSDMPAMLILVQTKSLQEVKKFIIEITRTLMNQISYATSKNQIVAF